MNGLEIIFEREAFPDAVTVWRLGGFDEQLENVEGLDGVINDRTAKNIKVRNIEKSLSKLRGSQRFSFRHLDPEKVGESVSFSEMNISFGMARLDIAGFHKVIDSRSTWLRNFLTYPGFLQARLINNEYELVQNLKEVYKYEMWGFPHSHLPLINNGLSSPFNAMVVDTSQNPGFTELNSGYIRCVGSEMWLSNRFFERIGRSRSDVLSEIDAEVASVGKNVTHIKSFERPFDDDSGVQLEIQRKLSKALYSKV